MMLPTEKQRLVLTTLPLLQGISAADLAHVLEHVRYKTYTVPSGCVVAEEGDFCNDLLFLMSGSLEVESRQDDRYLFTEYLQGPFVIEPDVLYGIQRTYSCTYRAADECQMLSIPKSDANRMIEKIEVFRLNYLNLLATLAVRRRPIVHPTPGPTLRDSVVRFCLRHTNSPTGKKIFTIRMSDLGSYLGTTRARISHVLHQLQDEGLVVMGRGKFTIPEMGNLTT